LKEVARDGAPAGDGSRGDLSAGDLFGVLWRELADILGTAAAASLVRRAVQRAGPRWPELAALRITRDSLEYRYTVPAVWNEPARHPLQALRALVGELFTLLVELTGTVVVNRLANVAELREFDLVPAREEQP
jgi:nucleotide-binding universal stress UspA family protein